MLYTSPSDVASAKTDKNPDVPEEVEEQLDRIFRALSDRTRRRILARLLTGPATVSELADPFAMSLPAVSKHLKVLERAGLIIRTADGRLRRCSLGAEPLRHVAAWLDPYRAFWTDTLQQLALFVEEEEDEP